MRSVNERGRTLIVVSAIGLCFCAVFGRSAYLAFGPNKERTELLVMTREPASLAQLTAHAEDLRVMTRDIESMSLREIRETTARTVTLVDRTNNEIAAQVETWERTRGRIVEDGNTYAEIRAQLAETERMRNEDVVRLQRALDEATPIVDRVLTVASTLLLGVFGSTLAAFLFPAKSIRALRRVIDRRRQRNNG